MLLGRIAPDGVLDDDKLTLRQQSEVLELLFSLTGQNDPNKDEGAVIGNCKTYQGPWSVGGADGAAVGFGFSSMDVSAGAKADEKAQKAFAVCWKPWKDYIKIAK